MTRAGLCWQAQTAVQHGPLVAGDLGFSELTIKALLGHGSRGSTQNYVHVDEALRLAVERVSAKIDNLLSRAHTVVLDFAA